MLSLYLVVFIQNLLRYTAKKILLTQPLKFGGDYRVGWRTSEEIKRIKGWEDLNRLGSTLSDFYEQAISRLELRTLVEVSEQTSHGNPRQVTLVKEMQNQLLELPDSFFEKCAAIASRALIDQENKIRDQIPF